MDRIAVGPIAGFLVDEYWIEKVLEQRSVRVYSDRMERVYDCATSAQVLHRSPETGFEAFVKRDVPSAVAHKGTDNDYVH